MHVFYSFKMFIKFYPQKSIYFPQEGSLEPHTRRWLELKIESPIESQKCKVESSLIQ